MLLQAYNQLKKKSFEKNILESYAELTLCLIKRVFEDKLEKNGISWERIKPIIMNVIFEIVKRDISIIQELYGECGKEKLLDKIDQINIELIIENEIAPNNKKKFSQKHDEEIMYG